MAQSRVERQALFAPVSEVSRRLQPRHLVEVTTHYAKAKVAKVVGGVSHAVKENGGTAAAVALGAVAVFDAGRRSADDRTAQPGPTPSEAHLSSGDAGVAASPSAQPRRHTVTNSARAKALVGSFGGLLLGHVIGRSIKPTEKERTLFGKTSHEVQDAATEFINQHAQGAKLVAAEAFGFARYTAALLAIMAAVSGSLSSPGDGDPPPP